MRKISVSDSVFFYTFIFKNLDLQELFTEDDIFKLVYDMLKNAFIDIMDLRFKSTGTRSHRIFKDGKYIGSKVVVEKSDLGLVCFQELPDRLVKKITRPSSYPLSEPRNSQIIPWIWWKKSSYLAGELFMDIETLDESGEYSRCGCSLHKHESRPLIGFFKGPYLDMQNPKGIAMYNQASWNKKTKNAQNSMLEIFGSNVWTASIELMECGTLWSLGFGWK
jgi:hypothetical protein